MPRIPIALFLALLACSLNIAAAQTISCYDATTASVTPPLIGLNQPFYTITGVSKPGSMACFTVTVSGIIPQLSSLPNANLVFSGELALDRSDACVCVCTTVTVFVPVILNYLNVWCMASFVQWQSLHIHIVYNPYIVPLLGAQEPSAPGASASKAPPAPGHSRTTTRPRLMI